MEIVLLLIIENFELLLDSEAKSFGIFTFSEQNKSTYLAATVAITINEFIRKRDKHEKGEKTVKIWNEIFGGKSGIFTIIFRKLRGIFTISR